MQAQSTTHSTDRKRWRPGWVNLAVLACYALLTVLMTWPLAANLGHAIPGDSFDGWQNYWNQWWIRVALVDQVRNPFVTDLLYHPTGVGLYFHTLNPFNGLTTLPIQLSAGLIPAYNAVVFLSWTLAGYGVYLLTLWVASSTGRQASIDSQVAVHVPPPSLPQTGGGATAIPSLERGGSGRGERSPQELQFSHRVGAFVAGAIFTFAPFHMAHLLGHMQVMSLQWIPFYVLYLARALSRQHRNGPWLRESLLAGLFLILAGLCDWYFVLYLFLFTAIAIVWAMWLAIRDRRGDGASEMLKAAASAILPPAVSGLIFALALGPVLLPMLREATQFSFMVRPPTDLYTLSASLADFLVPNRLHTLFRPASFAWLGNQIAPVSERTISLGYLPLLLAGVAVWRDRRRAIFWLLTAFLFLMLAMGPRFHVGDITAADIPENLGADPGLLSWTPFSLLNAAVPFMRISRSVSRYALMVQLCVAVLAGLGLGVLLSTRRGAKVAIGVGAFALLWVLAEFWVAPYPISPPDTPNFYTELRESEGGGALLNLPMNFDRPGYLLYQTVHQKPLAVAYISRDDPRTLTERAPVLQHFRHLGPDIVDVDPAMVGQTVLSDMGVDTVVLDRYKMPGGYEREYTEGLASQIFEKQTPIYEDDRLTVYQVQAPNEPQPYVVLGELNWGPLSETASGTVAREVLPGGAGLEMRHRQPGSALRLIYSTVQNAKATVAVSGSGEPPIALPPAPDGASILIPLESVGRDAGEIVLSVDQPGFFVTAIELVEP